MAMDFMPPVVVRLVADIKDFQGKVAAAEAQMGAASTRMGRSFNLMGAAAGVAGLAVAGLAAKLAIDGVQAAMADEKAAASLAQTMRNLGLAHDTAPVEAMIDSMQREYGVADDELRPAMDRLLRSTHDTGEAQKALKLAMDVAAGTGKDLSTVTAALGRAYDGNTGALGRLGAGIDQSILKGKNMDQIMSTLSKTFSGQATVAAQTYEGQVKRLGIGFDELKESIGYGFLNALNNTKGATDGLMKSFKDLEPAAKALGTSLGESVKNLSTLVRVTSLLTDQLDRLNIKVDGTDTAFGSLMPKFDWLPQNIRNMVTAFQALGLWLDYNTDSAEAGAKAWGEYWAAASGTGYRPSTSPPTLSKPDMPQGRDWQWFYGVNPSAQEALAKGRTDAGQLWTDYVEGLKQGSNGAGAKVKEAMTPIGVTIVDGLIESINVSKTQLSNAAQSQLDAYVQSYNQAVQDSRAYVQQISQSLVNMLDFSAAVSKAEETGQSIVDAFVEQSRKVAKFGENMILLAQAGLNQTSWEQIYSMGAENGAKIADALINGNMAQNIARTNEAVGSVSAMGAKVAEAAQLQFKQAGIDSAFSYLMNFVEEVSPKGKGFKALMAQLDELARASNRTAYLNIVTTQGASVPLQGPTYTPVDFSGLTSEQSSDLLEGILAGGGTPTFDAGGWVGKTGPAIVHQKEFVLSRDMLEGKQAIPEVVRGAVGRGGNTITVNANTNADPVAISREIAWNLRVGVI